MILGDGSMWGDLFPEDLIPLIINFTVSSWVTFPHPAAGDHETDITGRFFEYLKREKSLRRDLPFNLHSEVQSFDPVTGKQITRLDLQFIHGWREEVHFAFECKRLRVRSGKGIKSLAGEYVGEGGMMCFISGRYSSSVTSGGMLGYVMDGRCDLAVESVKKSISKNARTLQVNKHGMKPCAIDKKRLDLRESVHTRTGADFTIYHVFLPI